MVPLGLYLGPAMRAEARRRAGDCRKVRYQSIRAALRALQKWTRDPDARDPSSLCIYKCDECSHLHIGHDAGGAHSAGNAITTRLAPWRRT